MTDQIPLPPPDHIENVQGFVHDNEHRYYSEETMLAHAERLHAARVSSQATQLLASLQTEIDALRHQLQTLAELGNASGDAQILRMGYAAARLEIEHLNTQLQAAREEIKCRDTQEAAIGAGGVEPLRPRQCLHQISEPAPIARQSAERDALLQAAIDFIGTLTGMTPPPIEVAPPEVFAPFRTFVDRVQAITREHSQAAPTESVLIDGIAYDTPAPVAAELLRLNIEAKQPAPVAVAPHGLRPYICPTRTVADLVNNLLLLDQALPIHGAQYIEFEGRRRAIAVEPTVSRERVKDGRWIGEGNELNATVIWTRAEQPAPAAQGDAWSEIVTLPDSDDLVWLYCQDTNTIDGPVAPRPSMVDSWTHWAPAEAPSTAAIDAARAQAQQGGE